MLIPFLNVQAGMDAKKAVRECIRRMTWGKRGLCRQRKFIVVVAVVLLITAEFFRRPSYGRKKPHFFFETATPELLAAGQPREEQLRSSLAILERILITDYMKWHSATVSAIKEGRIAKGAVKTVIYSGYGGLGDRFRGLLHTFYRCVFSERLLLFKWDIQYPLSKAFVNHEGFNLTYDPVYFSPRVLPNGSYDEMYVGRLNHSESYFLSPTGTIWMAASPCVSFKDVLLWTVKFPSLPTSRKLHGTFPLKKKPKGVEFNTLVLRALFRPTDDLWKMMGQSTNPRNVSSLSLFNRDKNDYMIMAGGHEAYISVHARLGYGVNETGDRFNLEKDGLTIESVAECMAEKALMMAKAMTINPPRFYLATDTVEFRERFQEALLKQDRMTKVRYGTWDVKHVVELRNSNDEDLMQYFHTFTDLYMLSKGKALLQTRSGFSNLASWMGGIRSAARFDITDCVS